jgi:solute:Na+ symporter, SSS family
MSAHWTELVIFLLLFAVVTGLGFYAARWGGRSSLTQLDDWGLGGRKFGSWRSWFLIGGDIFTAYTFVAVPALVFGKGAAGFFALPYIVIVYPMVFLPLLRMWSVSRKHRYVTPADFVAGRYGSRTLALAVAVTGILATMPYIAVQLVGLEAVLRTMGLDGTGLARHAPVFVAFVILAVYTYRSGLRAPALIAWVKALLIYPVIVVAIFYLPAKLGGWQSIFDTAGAKFNPDGVLLSANNQLQYVTMALGSALALFLFPHALTGALASGDRDVLKRNMVALPAYSLALGLFALLGYVAIAANTQTSTSDSNTVIPTLFEKQFSSWFDPWFAGIAFAAIGIGALVPASIMSIAAANLYARNIYKAYLRRGATNEQETTQAKRASLVVKAGAVGFIIFVDPKYAIYLQLIASVIILQTLPAVAIALYTRWFHRWGLLAGWLVGLAWGSWMIGIISNERNIGELALKLGELPLLGWVFAGTGISNVEIYPGLVALLGNLVVATVVTIALQLITTHKDIDETRNEDYYFNGNVTELNEGNIVGTRRATVTAAGRERNPRQQLPVRCPADERRS